MSPKDDTALTPQALIAAVRASHLLGRDADTGGPIAVPSNGPRVARSITAAVEHEVLESLTSSDRVASRATVESAVANLRVIAKGQGAIRTHLRAAVDEGTVYVDLGRDDGAYVETTGYGWRVITPDEDNADSPVWRRTNALAPLPIPRPAHGTNPRHAFAALLGLSARSVEFRVLWGWAVAAYFADLHRPILWTVGAAGTGKTTRTAMVLNVIDPASELGGPPGKSIGDDHVRAFNRYVPSFDNVSTVSESCSDWLCRLVTGAMFEKRVLYTDSETALLSYRRAAVASSVVVPTGLRSDALTRVAFVHLPPVGDEERRTATELAREFEMLRPAVMAALFDDVADVLAHLPDTPTGDTPRLADYTVTLRALDAARGLTGDDRHETAYRSTLDHAMVDAAADDPFVVAVAALVDSRRGNRWVSTPSALHEALEQYRPVVGHATWPQSVRSLGRALVSNEGPLRALGVTATPCTIGKQRGWRLERIAEAVSASGEPEESSSTSTDAGEVGPATGPAPDLFAATM